jgi:bifunctional diaminopimelate decarboxylase / aspartate kinase
VFAEQRIYLVSQAANDLNFTFVVDEDQGDRLVNELHDRLIVPVREGTILGPTWQQLFAPPAARATPASAWWRRGATSCWRLAPFTIAPTSTIRRNWASPRRRCSAGVGRSRAVCDEGQSERAHPAAAGGRGAGLRVRVAGRDRARARERARAGPRPHPVHAEFRRPRRICLGARSQGIQLTIDNLYILREWGELFRGQRIFVRIDTGTGRGHHHHVRTAGAHAKFGVPLAQIDELRALTERHGVSVVGLHAHSGSGIFDADNWAEVATRLLDLAQRFPQLHTIDVGGGLGVPDGQEQPHWTWPSSTPRCWRCARTGPASRCGSSRGATWSPPPAC